ncbi:MAG: aquaporin family protein [Cellulomonas sp. 73-92]|nr:MAG: aquaporin family protein [Cellulomonas sp. 73-92]
MLVLLGTGVVANVILPKNKGFSSGWVVITFGWGLAVMSGVYVSFKSGAHINPAVTLGLYLNAPDKADQFAKGITSSFSNMLLYWLAQMIGAIIGAVLCWLAYKKHFDEDADPATKLGVFSTGPAIRSYGWNFFTEVIGTFVLVFVILAFGKNPASLGPLPVSFLVVGIGMSLGGPTGYAINPARDLGPRIAHAFLPIPGKGKSDWAYSWVPVFGPLVGGAIAGLVAHAYIV